MIMARNEDGTYSQVGFVKDNAGIYTEYIYDKDGDIVFEKGFTRETSGTVPLTINGIGKDLKDWSITGNTVKNGTPTPDNPIMPEGCGELETVGTKAGQYKIPISSAITTTPVYLGEVETTRRIAKIDLGTLNWGKTASGNFWAATAIQNIRIIGNSSADNAICDMFKEVSPNAVADEPYSFSSCLNAVGRPFINSTGFEDLTVEEFKEAMSGVYMYYVLANEETAVVNEPLRKIGGYTDTLSMEQAGVQIPTLNGTTVIDVDTTVKPTEMYIKYKSSK